MTKKKKTEYKYRIKEHLAHLSRFEERQAKEKLPELCGVSPDTWLNWLYIKVDDSREIRISQLQSMADYFGVGLMEMFTIEPTPIQFESLN